MKKNFLFALLFAAILTNGCAWFHHKSAAAKPAPAAAKTIVTPDASLTAKVVSVNTVGRFVVLNFPPGGMPKLQQTLFLYRAGLKVAEVKITGPQEEANIVADLVSGEAQVGDTVRDQ
jgi:hypothetical protein